MPAQTSSEFGELAAIYGKLFLAIDQFEKEMQGFLREKLTASLKTLALGAIQVDAETVSDDTAKDGWGRYIFSRASLKAFGSMKVIGQPMLGLGACWRRYPQSEKTTLPYAYLNVLYYGRPNAEEWKTFLKKVGKWMPGVSVVTNATFSSFSLDSDDFYRDSLDGLALDLDRLVEHLSTAVQKAAV
jgi:hypothetical protein